MTIEIGDYIKTPRFLTVRIEEVLSEDEAREKGYKEPTHYKNPDYEIHGKSTGINRMKFAAVIKDFWFDVHFIVNTGTSAEFENSVPIKAPSAEKARDIYETSIISDNPNKIKVWAVCRR